MKLNATCDCTHTRSAHFSKDKERCMVHGCTCLAFHEKDTPPDTVRIRVELLLFKPNAVAGMNHLVVMSETYFYRSGVEDGRPIIVKREGDYYRIQDGRHRVVASMMAGRPDVLAVIEED